MQVAKAGGPARGDGAPSSAHPDDHSVSYAPLYLTTGLGDVSFDIEHLQDLALSRLRLLKAAGDPSTPPVTSIADLRLAEREHGFHITPAQNPDHADLVLKDEAAHFLLRLALCRTHEQRQWFLARECSLFTMRLHNASMSAVLDKIKSVDGPEISAVPAGLLADLEADLDAVARGVRHEDSPTSYFQVDFEHVAYLVRSRRVLVRDGVAFVPAANVRDVVASQFRARLSHALVTASKAVGVAEHDPRMRAILDAVRDRHAAEEANRTDFEERGVGSISLNQLMDALPAMPLCQMNLMHKLGEDHHLRHSGRMQLGVFLKGCGLTMDESIVFWKREFGKGGIDGDKFNKNYAYNIRHHYGKEGKRKNLHPFPCIRVINDHPGPGEHHGCPYREFTPARLKATLHQVGAKESAINPILNSAKDGNFQAACGHCFAATQPGAHEMTETGMPLYFPSHPNDYFIEARTRRVSPEESGGAAVEGEEADEDMAPENSAPMETPVKTGENAAAIETPPAKTGREEEPNAELDHPAKRVRIDESESPAARNGTATEASVPPQDQPASVEAPIAEVAGTGAPASDGGKEKENEEEKGDSPQGDTCDIANPDVEGEAKIAPAKEAVDGSAKMEEDGSAPDEGQGDVVLPDVGQEGESVPDKEEKVGSAEIGRDENENADPDVAVPDLEKESDALPDKEMDTI